MNTSKSTPNLFDAIAKNAQQSTTTLVKQVNELATDITKSANNAVNAGVNTAKNFAKNIPGVNSLLPLRTNNTAANANVPKNAGNNMNKNVFMNNAFENVTNAANTAANAALNAVNNAANTVANNLGVNGANKGPISGWVWVAIVFVLIASVITGLLVFYKEQVAQTYANIEMAVKKAFGYAPAAPPVLPPTGGEVSGPAPVDLSGGTASGLLEQGASALRKILPSQKEVFNINANDFTYYDAEPMCRAIGAELATYDQVKEAWSKGANWCNYGWVKGQNAVYPTQKEFYEKLQSGPPEDQAACGVPGVNGGYFDNPEMRFGVNCYGTKPSQTANDVRLLEEKGILPQTPDTLKINQQAQEYKEKLGSIGVMPFSDAKWSEY